MSKTEFYRAKRKAKKAKRKARQQKLREEEAKVKKALLTLTKSESADVEVEELLCEGVAAMANVVQRFSRQEEEPIEEPVEFPKPFKKISRAEKKKKKKELQERDDEEKPLSNRQKKERRRLTITEFKQLVERPDLVEEHDRNAADPRLLIFLKMQRNTIPVPRHWSRKRKYLQGKRGYEKPPFTLPAFIKNTGITAIRDEQLRIYSEKTRKQKQRSTRGGARGKMAINYQTLHDAFFIHQTKPPLTLFGDVYHEQKEREIKYRAFKPGRLTDRLKKALGIPATWRVIAPGGLPVFDQEDDEKPREGQILAQGTELTWDETAEENDSWIKIVRPVNGWIQIKDDQKVYAKQVDHNCPTPWLIAQQRFGPPPAYPDLKIPGLNAPIPPGHEYGYGEGQWGKPPIGRDGQPLYGNPFGMYFERDYNSMQPRAHWGDLEDISDDDSSDDEDETSDEEELPDGVQSGINSGITSGVTSDLGTGTISASSLSQDFNLRKKAGGTDTPDSHKALYTVVQQQESNVSGSLFGSSHVYDFKNMDGGKEDMSRQRVDVALDPQDMISGTLDENKLKRKFEDAVADQDDLPSKRRRPGSRFNKNKEYDVKF